MADKNGPSARLTKFFRDKAVNGTAISRYFKGMYKEGEARKASNRRSLGSSAKAAAKPVKGTRAKGGDRMKAAYKKGSGRQDKQPKAPEQSAMKYKEPKKAKAKVTKPTRKPRAAKKSPKKEGFDFSGAIRRGMGGAQASSVSKVANMSDSAWRKAQRKAGL